MTIRADKMKKAGILILIITILLGVFLPASLAWFADHSRTVVGMNSYVHKSYFESGDGLGRYQYNVSYSVDAEGVEVAERGKDGGGQDLTTDKGCAFEIKYPVQLFYFAWLQYLGYFNQPETDEGEETGAVKQVYFYLSADLDMTGWPLPPIGTSTYPFVGNFDGNGHTIFNLTVQNVGTGTDASPTTLKDMPVDSISGAEIIGFFGVIGSMNNNGKVYGAIENDGAFVHSEFESYSYSGEINQVKNFALTNITIKTEATPSLVGIVAGYVNGELSNVRVGESGSVIKTGTVSSTAYTTNLSDYTLIGYATDDYKDTGDVVFAKVDTPTELNSHFNYSAQGAAAGWGGSIDMYGLLQRLSAVRRVPDPASDNPSLRGGIIPKTELHVIDPLNDNEKTETVLEYYDEDVFRSAGTSFTAGGSNKLYYFNTDLGGSYHVIPYDTGGRPRNYLIGLNTMYDATTVQQGKTVYTVTWVTEGNDYVYLNAFDYGSGDNYLNLNQAQTGLVGGNTATNHWILDNAGHLYTVTATYDRIYLNGDADLSVGASGTTVWTWNNNRFSYTYNGMTYYLQYSGEWTVVPEYYYLIGDGRGNYLRYNSYNNGLVNTTDSAQASHWTFSTSGVNPGGRISTVDGNNTRYLRYNNGLTTTTANNATSWTNNGTGLYNGSNYIRFNGTSWIAGPRGTYYAIRNGANYLNITAVSNNVATVGTGTSVADVSLNGHTLWTFSSTAGNPSGTVSATVNGTTYYLNDSAGTLTATTANNTSWSNDGTSIKNGSDYLVYDGGWSIETVNQMAIKSGNSYLNITGTNGTNATLGTGNSAATGSVSGHTMWTFSNSGQIYAVVSGNTYYLRNNNGTLTATRTDYSGWTVDGTHISSGDYYLNYSSGWKLSDPELLGYTIDYNGNYLNLTSTSTSTNNPIGTGTNVADVSYNGHTVWTFETTGTYPSGRMSVTINGTRYYLYGNSNNQNNRLRIATSPTASYANWTNSNGKLQVRSRYLRYSGGWQHSTTDSNNTLNFTPVYGEGPSVTLESNVPSTTVTSETEPVPSVQPEQINNTISDLNSSAVNGLRDFTQTSEIAPSGIPGYIPITTEGEADDFVEYKAGDSTEIFNVAQGNTGYIIGGAYDITSDGANSRRGDVRISAYDITSINSSYTPAGGFSNVYTIVGTSGNYSRQTINLNTGVCQGKTFNNFLTSKNQLLEILDQTNTKDGSVYGIHFMNAMISMDHIVTAPHAVVDGKAYENYELPEDAIDFNVHQKGYVTFYAGSYHNTNDSLFSLHEIQRNGSKITAIKEIRYIFSTGAESDDYIYMYKNDNSFSDGGSHPTTGESFSSGGKTYSLVFNAEWLWTEPRLISGGQNYVYYFEIPVNAGEFALGSVDGGVGAYLIYLDISANAQLVDRAAVTESFEEVTKTYEFPEGVTFRNTAISASNTNPIEPSALASMSTSEGSVSVTVTDDTHVGISGGTVNYVADGVTVNNSLSYADITATPSATTTTKIRRTTYYDYNVAMERYTVTEVVIRQTNGGQKTVTINAWNTGSDWDVTSEGATQIATMTDGFTPNIGSNTNGVEINSGITKTLEYAEVDGVYCYLINVSNENNAQALRIDRSALEGDLAIGTLLYEFCYAIKDNDHETDGAAIDYGYDCEIGFNQNAVNDAGLFTFSNRGYGISVTTTQTIHTKVVTPVTNNNFSVSLTTTQ